MSDETNVPMDDLYNGILTVKDIFTRKMLLIDFAFRQVPEVTKLLTDKGELELKSELIRNRSENA